jgi:hypothetical protein
MIVSCACCGFDGNVHDYEAWSRHGTYPTIWICDVCAADLR